MSYNGIVFVCFMFIGVSLCFDNEFSNFEYNNLFTPCKKCDDDCIKKSAQAVYEKLVHGIPSLGIQSLEPIHRQEISGDIQKLHFNFTDSVISGYSHCYVNKIKVDFYDSCFKMELLCHDFTLTGKYYLDGYIFDDKVNEKGHYKIFCPKYKLGIDTKFMEVKDDGKLHMILKDSTITTFSNAEEKITIKLDNCKESKELETLLNTNWRQAVEIFQGKFTDENLKLLVASANKLLEHISINDMFLH